MPARRLPNPRWEQVLEGRPGRPSSRCGGPRSTARSGIQSLCRALASSRRIGTSLGGRQQSQLAPFYR